MIGIEPKKRVHKSVYIEEEFLAALPPRCDLNFEINLALELKLTSENPVQVALVRKDRAAS